MTKPVDYIDNQRVGSISRVNSNRFVVELDPEAPHGTALNTGRPKRFPGVNSYVLVPIGSGFVAGLVTEVYVEPAAFPKREGYEDFGVVDLPFPARHLEVIPVGTIEYDQDGPQFERGVHDLPTVGDSALIPRAEEARCLVEMEKGHINVGKAPHLDRSRVSLDPDRLFGRHTAVLGNTGSGKSCTVTKIIRECVSACTEPADSDGSIRFVILDPNGEYASALRDLPSSQVYSVNGDGGGEPLRLPGWILNGLEWSAFARAKPDAQRPVLLEALQILRSDRGVADGDKKAQLARDLKTFLRQIRGHRNNLAELTDDFGTQMDVIRLFKYVIASTREFTDDEDQDGQEYSAVSELLDRASQAYNEATTKGKNGNTYPDEFNPPTLDNLIEALEEALDALPDVEPTGQTGEDRPVSFSVTELGATALNVAQQKGNERHIRPMVERLRSLFSLERTQNLLAPDADIEFSECLEQFFGTSSSESKISIIDLSLVPEDVVHLVTAVLARVVFETLQRYRKLHGELLPTSLVVDEAHNFMSWKPRGQKGEEYDSDTVCRNIFRKIAKEGRKFGLGLVVSSQRPAELDDTVLSQCNTVLLHRLSNQRDFDKVSALVPSQLSGFLDFLPALPQRQALVLGAAVSIPVLMEVDHLPEDHRPDSKDPEFWKCWTTEPQTSPELDGIVRDWQGD